jgi:hypothetical protein
MGKGMRWFESGWTIGGVAHELNRVADKWEYTGSPRDDDRVYAEHVGYYPLGLVLSLVRYHVMMKSAGVLHRQRIKILAIQKVAPETGEELPVDLAEAGEFAEEVFKDGASLAWVKIGKDARKRTNQQWVCFYDDRWRPIKAPHPDLVAGAEDWGSHPARDIDNERMREL